MPPDERSVISGRSNSPVAFGHFIAVVPSSIPDLSDWAKISLAIMAFGLVFTYQRVRIGLIKKFARTTHKKNHA